MINILKDLTEKVDNTWKSNLSREMKTLKNPKAIVEINYTVTNEECL